MMRHALAYEAVGFCQSCGDALTSRDVLETGQARLCPTCWDDGRKLANKQIESAPALQR